MESLIHKGPRACVAWALTLTLLGLGALDASLCRGADGHLGIDTRVNSCCRTGAPEIPSADPVSQSRTASLDPPCGGSICKDTPLMQGIPTARIDGVAAGPFSPSIAIPQPPVVSTAACGTTPPWCSGSILCRLRSTSLLI